MNKRVTIVDRGRGPQLSTNRITVLDVFYYLQRGHDFAFIHEALPDLSSEEFDVVMAFVQDHRDELVEKARQGEDFHRRGAEAQEARGGIFATAEENLTTEARVARLKARLRKKSAKLGNVRNYFHSNPFYSDNSSAPLMNTRGQSSETAK